MTSEIVASRDRSSSTRWNPSIVAAAASEGPSFTITLGELEYDDPFTALGSYDGRLAQP